MKLCLFLLICCQVFAVIHSQPFRVTVVAPRTGSNGNEFYIHCQNTVNSSTVNQAKFFRNGATFSEDECMEEYATVFNNGSAKIHIIPSCEGYIQCGINNMLSPSILIYAYPEFLTGVDREIINLQSTERDDISLPCPLSVSSLEALSIMWFRNLNGEPRQIFGNISEDDYSIVLSNLTVLNSGHYYCRTASTELNDRRYSILTGPMINLSVRRRHASPRLLTNITYLQDFNSQHIFRIKVEGTPPLVFKWFLDSEKINRSTEREIGFSNDGQMVSMSSEVVFTDLPVRMAKLSVNILNRDSSGHFRTSQTGFLLPYSISISRRPILRPTLRPTPSVTCIGDVVIPFDQQLIEFTMMYVIPVVLFLFSLILLVITISLSTIICHLKHSRKCHSCKLLLRGNSNITADSDFGTSTPLEPMETQYERQDTQLAISPPAASNHLICHNPIAAIMIQVGDAYRYKEMTERTLSTLLERFLLDVVDDRILDCETSFYASKLQENIIHFNNMLLQRRTSLYSRQASNRSNIGRDSIDGITDSPLFNPRRSHGQLVSPPNMETSLVVSAVSPPALRLLSGPPLLSFVEPTSRRENLAAPLKTLNEEVRKVVRQESCEEYKKAQEDRIIMVDYYTDDDGTLLGKYKSMNNTTHAVTECKV